MGRWGQGIVAPSGTGILRKRYKQPLKAPVISAGASHFERSVER
jgi:hypothetical protein